MAATGTMLQTDKQLKHRQVREFVLDRILTKKLKVGDALPTEGLLAESLSVGRNTVRQALGDLVSEGYIRRIPGRGVFVAREVQKSRESSMGVFGLILPDVRGSLYPSLIKGFGEIAGRSGHSIAIYETGGDVIGQGDAILQVIDRRVVGAAIVPNSLHGIPNYQLRQLEEHGIPLVLCHRGVDEVRAPVITWSWAEVARLAAQEIVKLGHRRVAFVACLRHRYSELYEKTFRQTIAEHGVELSANHVLYNDCLLKPACDDEARRELKAMLLSPQRPTAIFASDLGVGERVYHEAMHLGLRVPEDLSIVAFGGKWREGSIREQLATVAVDEVELGRIAARVLGGLEANQEMLEQYRQTVLPLEFIAGRSLAPISSNS